jgi:hypothetical protein
LLSLTVLCAAPRTSVDAQHEAHTAAPLDSTATRFGNVSFLNSGASTGRIRVSRRSPMCRKLPGFVDLTQSYATAYDNLRRGDTSSTNTLIGRMHHFVHDAVPD